MARSSSSNFFVAHYDWLAAGAALAALAGALAFFFGALGADADGSAADAVRRIESRKPEAVGVKPVDMAEYARAVKFSKTPPTVAEVVDKAESFLASGRRVKCAAAECALPIPADAKVCPFCGEKQPEEVKVVYDTDGDGMPDEWEKRYGFNPNDPADAALDADGDGFTNLEEFEAKTDPTDKSSHPDYLDSLKLVPPLKETMLPFYLRTHMKIPAGQKLEFFDPVRRNDYGKKGRAYSVLVGEEIGDTGFVAKEFSEKTEKRKIKGGGDAVRTVDVSEATIERKSDGKVITLVLDEKRKPVDVQARLVYERGEGKEFLVVPGDEIDLNGTKYAVKAVKRQGKGASVALEQLPVGKLRTLEALEP